MEPEDVDPAYRPLRIYVGPVEQNCRPINWVGKAPVEWVTTCPKCGHFLRFVRTAVRIVNKVEYLECSKCHAPPPPPPPDPVMVSFFDPIAEGSLLVPGVTRVC